MKRWMALFFVVFLHLSPLAAQDPIIVTAAGGGPNNMPALEANVGDPFAVAVDADGNLFIVASELHLVFKVDVAGNLTVAAGNGVSGFSGDGGPARDASLSFPSGVAVDAAGNLCIADTGNQRIRRVDPSGVITTVAGNGVFGFSGDGGPATEASLRSPTGVAVDAAGNLYIADQSNHRIRRVDPSGVITTVAGDGVSGFSGDWGPATDASLREPRGVAVDVAGNLYIADTDNQRIRRVDPSGFITTAAGNGVFGFSGDGGSATSASLREPFGVAVDADGNLYIADTNNNRIRRVDPSGVITTVAGNGVFGFSGDGGPATDAALRSPFGVAANAAGNLYSADRGNNRIRRVDPSGVIDTVAGNGVFGFSGDGGPAADASLFFPTGVAVDAAGNLYIADRSNHRIRRLDPSGAITTAAGNRFAGSSGDGGPATDASLREPRGVAVDAAGNLYIADTDNQRIRRVDPSGVITTVAGNGVSGFSGDGGPAADASLFFPTGVAVDAAGNLYIADENNHRIRRVDPSGVITTVAGNGVSGFSGDGGPATDASLRFPEGLAVDADGNLYIADFSNHRIRRVDPSGVITTVAGNGLFGFSGDGGPAVSAALAFPLGIVLDPAGNLYIADFSNHRIRKVNVSPLSDVDGEGVLLPECTGTTDGQGMEWYTVSNNRAMFQGTATINGQGLYTFRVSAFDGALAGGQPDNFDIRIWAGTDTESDPVHKAKNDLAGGNIVVHKK